MPDPLTPDKIREAQFVSLVMTIEESAMYGLGKLAHPITKKAEKNLIQAKAAIDMIDMIAEKTKGNLNEHEKRFIENTLTQLRLNFIEESKESNQNNANKENVNEGIKDETK